MQLQSLTLALCILHVLAIPIQILSPETTQLAIQAPSVQPVPPTHDKRYYYPETLPDEDELESLHKAKEQAMREAGLSSPKSEMKTQMQMQMHNSDVDAPITVPVHPVLDSRSLPIYHCPPWEFFFVASGVVCAFTIIRGIRKS